MSRLLLAAVFAAVLPAAARAEVKWFHSPTQNIECEVSWRDLRGSYAYCQTFSRPESVKLDVHGRTHLCHGTGCLGNGPENAFTLHYGHVVHVGHFACTSTRNGIRCSIGHRGFLISRRGITTH